MRGDDPILVDTSVLHEIAERSPKGKLANALIWDMTPLTCMHTAGEAIVCIHRNSPKNKQFPKRMMNLVRRWQWLKYPKETPQIYASVVAAYVRSGGKKAKCNAADFWILACAVANEVALMTADDTMAKVSYILRHPTMHIQNGPHVHVFGDMPR